jgi:acetaldehyde dehydrogenase
VLDCTLFIGRNLASPGIVRAKTLGVHVSDLGIEAVLKDPNRCDLVFDATSAADHRVHWSVLDKLGKITIDMTPSRAGHMIVPAVNLKACLDFRNVNMVSCGGQAAIPLAHLVGQAHPDIEYIEVVTSIASRSAGLGTRINIDEYVETTEDAVRLFSGCRRAKTILILNPAIPPINMQTTISAKVANPDLDRLKAVFTEMVALLRSYVPGYEVIVPPIWESNRIVISVRVRGLGDYLPPYAGNLDILNCAAIATAEEYAKSRYKPSYHGAKEEHYA